MSVQLFPHNQIAYNSALEMLESCGKAAIVHPTGTGKSFIGFKLSLIAHLGYCIHCWTQRRRALSMTCAASGLFPSKLSTPP